MWSNTHLNLCDPWPVTPVSSLAGGTLCSHLRANTPFSHLLNLWKREDDLAPPPPFSYLCKECPRVSLWLWRILWQNQWWFFCRDQRWSHNHDIGVYDQWLWGRSRLDCDAWSDSYPGLSVTRTSRVLVADVNQKCQRLSTGLCRHISLWHRSMACNIRSVFTMFACISTKQICRIWWICVFLTRWIHLGSWLCHSCVDSVHVQCRDISRVTGHRRVRDIWSSRGMDSVPTLAHVPRMVSAHIGTTVTVLSTTNLYITFVNRFLTCVPTYRPLYSSGSPYVYSTSVQHCQQACESSPQCDVSVWRADIRNVCHFCVLSSRFSSNTFKMFPMVSKNIWIKS